MVKRLKEWFPPKKETEGSYETSLQVWELSLEEDENNLFSMLMVGCPLQTDDEDTDFIDHNPQDRRDRSPEVFFLWLGRMYFSM